MSKATVIEVELLSGRYHAHLWGESQFGMAGAEWPPSPWRLLRALAAAWFAGRPRPSSEQDRDSLLEALGRAEPPEIWLRPAAFHEIRYYQPVRMGGADRVLHHDFFVVPEGGCFWFRFNVTLTDSQRHLLADLLGGLRYLGRSESRARLRVGNQNKLPPGATRVAPRSVTQPASELPCRFIALLCTAPDFRASDLWTVRDAAKTHPSTGYPPHLVDALLKKRKPLPDGARWVEYAVPDTILLHEIRPRPKQPVPKSDIEIAELHFRLNRRVPIPIGSLVAVARAFRESVVKRYRVLNGSHSCTLTGRKADGKIAQGHQHAYYLPQPAESGLAIESLIVRIPTGKLRPLELNALLGVTQLNIGGPYPIRVIPERQLSKPKEYKPAPCWHSVTPFVPPLRHRPGRGSTSVEEQAAFLAEQLCGHRPISVRSRPGPGGLGAVSPLLVHAYSGQGHAHGGRHWTLTRRLGFWLELTFAEPVVLSAALGKDAHFGAGQFEATEHAR